MKSLINPSTRLLLIITLLFSINVQAQINGNRFIVKLEGGFSKEASSNMLTRINAYEGNVKSWDAGLSIGYAVNNWIWGVGFEYASAKTEATGRLYTISNYELELSKFSSKLPSGKIFAGYYLPILKNLYFKPIFYFSYGKISTDVLSYYANRKEIPSELGLSGSGSPYTLNSIEYDSSFDYLGFQLAPEFTFFFTSHFGCNLQLGGAMMEVADNSWSNKQMALSFSPKYWKVGLVFGF